MDSTLRYDMNLATPPKYQEHHRGLLNFGAAPMKDGIVCCVEGLEE